MHKTITLSGWGQPHDALRDIAPEARHVDYARKPSVEHALDIIRQHSDAHTVIGWSMGGQMAVRAIADGIIAPQRLVLIATPYSSLGNGPNTMATFRENFARDPQRTLRKSYALITHGDSRGAEIEPHLAHARERLPAHDWLFWLDALAEQSAQEKTLAHFPRTLLIHGQRDVVVTPDQSETYLRHLPHARLHKLEDAGHAPHWHDAAQVRRWIEEEA